MWFNDIDFGSELKFFQYMRMVYGIYNRKKCASLWVSCCNMPKEISQKIIEDAFGITRKNNSTQKDYNEDIVDSRKTNTVSENTLLGSLPKGKVLYKGDFYDNAEQLFSQIELRSDVKLSVKEKLSLWNQLLLSRLDQQSVLISKEYALKEERVLQDYFEEIQKISFTNSLEEKIEGIDNYIKNYSKTHRLTEAGVDWVIHRVKTDLSIAEEMVKTPEKVANRLLKLVCHGNIISRTGNQSIIIYKNIRDRVCNIYAKITEDGLYDFTEEEFTDFVWKLYDLYFFGETFDNALDKAVEEAVIEKEDTVSKDFLIYLKQRFNSLSHYKSNYLISLESVKGWYLSLPKNISEEQLLSEIEKMVTIWDNTLKEIKEERYKKDKDRISKEIKCVPLKEGNPKLIEVDEDVYVKSIKEVVYYMCEKWDITYSESLYSAFSRGWRRINAEWHNNRVVNKPQAEWINQFFYKRRNR